ncbi:MAG TPA: DUF4142 domain-containing protein [Leeuwenhoekiella sp.]|nr:DUF4142 domain-containing protein [Leeuwenhoekiella sp.]
MKKNVLFFALTIMLTAVACNNGSKTDPKEIADTKNEQKEEAGTLNKEIDDDAKFVTEVSGGVLMEIELGNYAQEHASSDAVKQFGATMVKDHGKDRENLKALAESKNITIPSEPGDDFQKHIAELEKYEGAEFDKNYISFMVSDHKEDIDEFEKEVDNGQDQEIVAFATKGLPVLKEHLKMAEAIDDK